MSTELKEQPEFSIVKLTGTRAHQVDQVQVMLQVGKNLHLTEQGCELRSVQGIVDSFHSNLGERTRVKEALGFTDIHAAKVATAQQLPDAEFGSEMKI